MLAVRWFYDYYCYHNEEEECRGGGYDVRTVGGAGHHTYFVLVVENGSF
jgi:hypothetical protein